MSHVAGAIVSTGLAVAMLLHFETAAGARPGGAGAEDYRRRIETWHAQRLAGLRRETGWLTLVGLFPLEPGDNRLGSAEDNEIRLPAGAPAHGGILRLEDDGVLLLARDDVVITHEGRRVAGMRLTSDGEGAPTKLDLGPLQFYVIDRGGRKYVRVKDRNSPRLRSFRGIDRFPVDTAWRIRARWEPYDPPRTVRVPSVLGYETEAECPGAAVFAWQGKTYRLEPTGDPETGLFFVFGDRTNEHETYGGGRFLSVDPPGDDGTVVLDFNRAYNPPCVFTPYATCPLPRPENRLPFRVEAGEKVWGQGHAPHGEGRHAREEH